MEWREKDKAVAARAKAKADRVHTKGDRKFAALESPRKSQEAKVCPTQF